MAATARGNIRSRLNDGQADVKPERQDANAIKVRAMESADPTMRLLTTDDLDGASGLSGARGWNQRVADSHMLVQLAPAGGFAATVDVDRVLAAILI